MYRNLAITELCVGIIADPLAVTYSTSVVKKKMGYLLLRLFGRKPFRLYLMGSVFINIDCNKRGQTSRLVARAQIQTSCNLENNNVYKCIYVWILSIVGSSSYLLIIKPKIALRQFNMSGRID